MIERTGNQIVIEVGGRGSQGVPGQGVPTGGDEGQFLAKASDTNYDTEWKYIGGNNDVIAVAGQTISALRLVYTDPTNGKILYADKDNANSAFSLLGVTKQSGAEDSNILVCTSGILEDANWSWNMAGNVNLFLGTNGDITQGVLSGAVSQKIGYAISTTKILIRINQLILT